VHLTDLPFLKGLTLPTWCSRFKIQIDEINNAEGFGFGKGIDGDLKFLIGRTTNKLLEEYPGTRQDGAWFFNQNYAGSLAIKFYMSPISKKRSNENEYSSDIRLSFLSKAGAKHDALKAIRNAFEKSIVLSQSKGVLRIHLLFLNAQGGIMKSYVDVKKENGIVVSGDVMVYIDCDNMKDFFDDNQLSTREY
jgi:hypothetical protein